VGAIILGAVIGLKNGINGLSAGIASGIFIALFGWFIVPVIFIIDIFYLKIISPMKNKKFQLFLSIVFITLVSIFFAALMPKEVGSNDYWFFGYLIGSIHSGIIGSILLNKMIHLENVDEIQS
jgi:uncharacterized membrane protein YfcA